MKVLTGTEFKIKEALETKLGDSLFELAYRMWTKSSKLTDIQRMYGVCLGLRMALLEFNKVTNQPKYDFRYEGLMNDLLKLELSTRPKADMPELASYFKGKIPLK